MSQDQPKRPRGRPRLHDPMVMEVFRRTRQNVHTDRHRQNHHFAWEALTIIGLHPTVAYEREAAAGRALGQGEQPPIPWLVDWEASTRGKQGAVKYGVLTELGRMSAAGFPDDYIRAMAERLAEMEWTAKEAEQRLREIRLRGYRD